MGLLRLYVDGLETGVRVHKPRQYDISHFSDAFSYTGVTNQMR